MTQQVTVGDVLNLADNLGDNWPPQALPPDEQGHTLTYVHGARRDMVAIQCKDCPAALAGVARTLL